MTTNNYPSGFAPPSPDLVKLASNNSSDDEEGDYLQLTAANIRERITLFNILHPKEAPAKVVQGISKKRKVAETDESTVRRSARHAFSVPWKVGKGADATQQDLPQTSGELSVSQVTAVPPPNRSEFAPISVSSSSSADFEPTDTSSEQSPSRSETQTPVRLSPIVRSKPRSLVNYFFDTGSSLTGTPNTNTKAPDNHGNESSIMSESTVANDALHHNDSASETEKGNDTLNTNNDFSYDSGKENMSPRRNEPQKKKRRPKKKPRLIGKVITSGNALPTFSRNLHRDLKEGTINRVTLNNEVKDYIEETTGDLYLSQEEWNIMCQKLVEEYPVLCDADDPEGYRDLKYKLRNSITSKRSYKLNGIPSRNKQPSAVSEPSTPSTSSSNINDQMLLEIQCRTRDSARLIHLIKATLNSRKNQSPDEKIEKYPHYKNGEMLIYEYALLINQEQNQLLERAETLLQVINTGTDEATVEQQLEILRDVQSQLLPNSLKKKNLKPALICKDVQEVYGDINALSAGHAEHAPFCVATLDTNQLGERIINKCLLIYKSGVISQLDNPTLPEVLLLLLGSYFVFNIAYPPAYNSFFRLLEKQIHGAFSEHTSRQRAKKEYFNFMKFTFQKNLVLDI